MPGWSCRLVSLLVLLAVVAGVVPRAASASHCRVEDAPSGHQSHHDHDGSGSGPASQHTGSGEQCPHCPPVECRRHVHCVASVDSAVLEARPSPPPSGFAAVAAPSTRLPFGQPLAPPTPPPQRLL